MFSSSITWPGWSAAAMAWAWGPTMSSARGTGRLRNSSSRAATGFKLRAGTTLPLGRPRCEHKITAAPFSSKNRMVGSAPMMRFSSVILVPVSLSMGTLKSTRTSTFLPCTFTSSMVFFIIILLFDGKLGRQLETGKGPHTSSIIYHLYRLYKRFWRKKGANLRKKPLKPAVLYWALLFAAKGAILYP